ncbi:hypothetical protein CCH79_00011371 [Gambusia affinis]|uniref:SH2 domain-containing protein n=1 Tax=Gambusia affinis TaxID=33528 RepID=A0A315V339_GAMAF|nr:hypothetical protein CCH79_00011371 [Gambusia affinis]
MNGFVVGSGLCGWFIDRAHNQSAFTSTCRERGRWAPGSEGAMETEGAAVRSIYYGRIGSKVTEKLLEKFGHDGSFMLRDSETVPGAYCLCDTRGRLLRFGTIESLIDHYRSHPTSHQGVAPLILPLERATVPSNWIQGLVYMEMNGGQSGQHQKGYSSEGSGGAHGGCTRACELRDKLFHRKSFNCSFVHHKPPLTCGIRFN